MSVVKIKHRSWGSVLQELKGRILLPAASPLFVFYFVFAVIFVGGVGIWLEVVKLLGPGRNDPSMEGLIAALVTSFFSLAGTCLFQAIIEFAEDYVFNVLLVGSLLVFSAAMYGFGKLAGANLFLTCLAVAYTWSMLMWWMANAKNKTLSPALDAAIGGDAGQGLGVVPSSFKQ